MVSKTIVRRHDGSVVCLPPMRPRDFWSAFLESQAQNKSISPGDSTPPKKPARVSKKPGKKPTKQATKKATEKATKKATKKAAAPSGRTLRSSKNKKLSKGLPAKVRI